MIDVNDPIKLLAEDLPRTLHTYRVLSQSKHFLPTPETPTEGTIDRALHPRLYHLFPCPKLSERCNHRAADREKRARHNFERRRCEVPTSGVVNFSHIRWCKTLSAYESLCALPRTSVPILPSARSKCPINSPIRCRRPSSLGTPPQISNCRKSSMYSRKNSTSRK